MSRAAFFAASSFAAFNAADSPSKSFKPSRRVCVPSDAACSDCANALPIFCERFWGDCIFALAAFAAA